MDVCIVKRLCSGLFCHTVKLYFIAANLFIFGNCIYFNVRVLSWYFCLMFFALLKCTGICKTNLFCVEFKLCSYVVCVEEGRPVKNSQHTLFSCKEYIHMFYLLLEKVSSNSAVDV